MFTMTSIPAQKVYSPPSPILSCGKRLTASFGHDKKLLAWRGTAISIAMNASIPRNALFTATDVEERPTLTSTM